MELQEVNSRMFAKIGWKHDEEDEAYPLGSVVVEFPAKTDKEPILARYFGVPEDVYLDVMQAESRGAAFASKIKGQYGFEYITATEATAL